ncbi:hypothetical protein [Aliarcobacter butzleri]|uniref:hypothetical protein n=1 Tax=Aliarcobacter butzleri TaxID=28197 RepID=UPI0012605DBE|nr:hypothetical protein [Aliarcobacter butzleri]
MNEDELEKRIKLSEELIKVFKPLVKETVYENYIEDILKQDFRLNGELTDFQNNSYAVFEIEDLLKKDKKTKEEVLLVIKDLIYSSLNLKKFEDFLQLTKFLDKYEKIKDLNLETKNRLIESTLIYSQKISYPTINENLKYMIESKSYYKGTSAVLLDTELKEYYERYLFFKNLDLYLKKGKHSDQLRQLCTSSIKTRGKFNDNNSPLTHFKRILLNEDKNENEFLHLMTEKIELFKIESRKQELYPLDNRDFNFEDLAKNEDMIIYQFIISSETPKKYFLDRDKLIYAKYNSKEDRYSKDFIDFFSHFTINKADLEDIKVNVGDKVLIFSPYNNFAKADTFLKKYSHYIEDNKKINLCSDKDIEKIRDYFIQVLSKKISDNFEDLNKERDFKIKELEEQYYAIPMPTHEDLLKICTHEENHYYNNFEKFLKIEEREVIGSQLRDLRKLQNNSLDILKAANQLISVDCSLNKKQKEGAEAIFDKYYSVESKRIEFNFTFKRKHKLFDKGREDENEIINKKIEILKTTCVKSDFDFS